MNVYPTPMKKTTGLGLAAICLGLTSCVVGPQQLRRTVDDWDRKLYVENPWIDAALNIIPVIPFAGLGASIVDFFVGNAYHFWFNDAWDGAGTNFRHFDVQSTDGELESLLFEDAKFLMNE